MLLPAGVISVSFVGLITDVGDLVKADFAELLTWLLRKELSPATLENSISSSSPLFID